MKEKLRVLGLNVIPNVLITRGLMAYYERDGSDYREMENHNGQALQMTTWSFRALLVTVCEYAYVSDCMIGNFHKERLIDIATVNGISYSSVSSLCRLLWEQQDQRTQGDGYRSPTITEDYDMEITVKRVERQ